MASFKRACKGLPAKQLHYSLQMVPTALVFVSVVENLPKMSTFLAYIDKYFSCLYSVKRSLANLFLALLVYCSDCSEAQSSRFSLVLYSLAF